MQPQGKSEPNFAEFLGARDKPVRLPIPEILKHVKSLEWIISGYEFVEKSGD